jgi:hypothetical protein
VALLFAVALLCIPRKRTLGLLLGWGSLGLLLVLGWLLWRIARGRCDCREDLLQAGASRDMGVA